MPAWYGATRYPCPDIQAIREITEKWESAVNAGDTDTLMSFYSDYAVKFPPNEPAVIGKEAIRSSYQNHFEKQIRQEKHAVADIKVSGDLAVRIFGRQPDGSWKIIYMMWSDESLISPDQAE
jgi:ketosteroid isomerase-like protein